MTELRMKRYTQEVKEKGCLQCNVDYQCFDCECFEMQWLKGYTLQDDLTWKKGDE